MEISAQNNEWQTRHRVLIHSPALPVGDEPAIFFCRRCVCAGITNGSDWELYPGDLVWVCQQCKSHLLLSHFFLFQKYWFALKILGSVDSFCTFS